MTRPGAFPKGLIGAIGLIVAVECAGIVPESVRLPDAHERLGLSWLAANRAASGPEGGAEVLCFGDSLIKLGAVPRVLQDRLGWTAYNLAVLGGPAPTSYYLLRRVLEQGHHPRALIVDFSPLLLAMAPRTNLKWWSGLPDGRERLELAWQAGDPAFAGLIAVPGLIASWSARDAVRSALGLEGPPVPDGNGTMGLDDRRIFERNWAFNRGAQVAPRQFVPLEGALPQADNRGRWRWRPQPVHARFVERFLALASSRQIPVFWVLAPAMSQWLARNEDAGTIDGYQRFVRAQMARFPGLIVLDGTRLGWDRAAFRDPIHLNRDGALRLSRAIADSIARRPGQALDGSRWLKLDGNADLSSQRDQHLVEDLEQSRLAVNSQGIGPYPREGSK